MREKGLFARPDSAPRRGIDLQQRVYFKYGLDIRGVRLNACR